MCPTSSPYRNGEGDGQRVVLFLVVSIRRERDLTARPVVALALQGLLGLVAEALDDRALRCSKSGSTVLA